MKIYYKPKAWKITAVSDPAPFTVRGSSGTVQISTNATATNSIGDGWCLHHVCGTLGLPFGGTFQANYDNTYHQLDREPVENDTLYTFLESAEFNIVDHKYKQESAKAGTWGDAYNTEARLIIRGYVPRETNDGAFGDNYRKLLWSPVMVVEDCEGNFFRVMKGDSTVSVSVTNPDQIFLELQVSSDFKFLAIE